MAIWGNKIRFDCWSANERSSSSTLNDSISEDGENIEIFNGGINLWNIQVEQAGEYTCLAIQKLGEFENVQRRDMELIVEREQMILSS